MINPEGLPNWRPTNDFVRPYELDDNLRLTEVYEPLDKADAAAYVRELALPEVVAYDGFAVQGEMIEDLAVEMFPHLFGTLPMVAKAEDVPPAAANVVEQCTRSNGQVDWNKVARLTRYAVSRMPLTERA